MRLRNVERFKTGGAGNNIQLGIPLAKTADGRVYRYSPNENAHPRLFLLGDRVPDFALPETLTARMTHAPGTPGTVCPYSGNLAEDSDFTHPDDVAAAKEVVAHAFHADAADAIHGMFDDLARKFSGNKFLTIKTGLRPSPKPAPRFARSDLLREVVCDECGRDYGVYAISLFCPDCGAPNIHLHFAREVALVREQVELAGNLASEQSELAYRLMGNAHEDVLTAFEATLKTVYLYKVASRPPDAEEVKPVGNAFQNIERGQKALRGVQLRSIRKVVAGRSRGADAQYTEASCHRTQSWCGGCRVCRARGRCSSWRNRAFGRQRYPAIRGNRSDGGQPYRRLACKRRAAAGGLSSSEKADRCAGRKGACDIANWRT